MTDHPRYGPPLGGAPTTIDGVTFRPYRAGVTGIVRCSDDHRITVAYVLNNRSAGFHTVAVDGVHIDGANSVRARRFREPESAMRAGIKLWRAKGAIPHGRL